MAKQDDRRLRYRDISQAKIQLLALLPDEGESRSRSHLGALRMAARGSDHDLTELSDMTSDYGRSTLVRFLNRDLESVSDMLMSGHSAVTHQGYHSDRNDTSSSSIPRPDTYYLKALEEQRTKLERLTGDTYPSLHHVLLKEAQLLSTYYDSYGKDISCVVYPSTLDKLESNLDKYMRTIPDKAVSAALLNGEHLDAVVVDESKISKHELKRSVEYRDYDSCSSDLYKYVQGHYTGTGSVYGRFSEFMSIYKRAGMNAPDLPDTGYTELSYEELMCLFGDEDFITGHLPHEDSSDVYGCLLTDGEHSDFIQLMYGHGSREINPSIQYSPQEHVEKLLQSSISKKPSRSLPLDGQFDDDVRSSLHDDIQFAG